MPRIRSVHPDLHRDKTLALASASAERTFVRLWCHLDDEGRGEDDLDLLKADLYPRHRTMDADAIDADLRELESLGLVIRYAVDGVRYIACKPSTWTRYQRPQKKVESTLPPPPENPTVEPFQTPTVGLQDVDGSGTGEVSPVVGVVEGGEREQEQGAADAATSNVVDVFSGGFPTRKAPTMAKAIATWAQSNDVTLPEPAQRSDVYRSLLDITADRLGAEHPSWRRVTQTLCVEYVADATGVQLEPTAAGHVGRLVSEFGAHGALRGLATAIAAGAGLDELHADDARALTKYAHKVCQGEARSA